ncbi:beta C-S lyase family protein [Vibrio algarum]|uniref:Cystathionine beta-lyase n=1 Tax=Vibrio algarum TaxID=3020714 RepID=A0ABT4YWY5_9VIBR|nr:hypothetical protein [Vibrio sp. KJ40-1]MDB1126095.1 hypothetical protein [Vibrio sp. KJ40-1]
MAKYNFDSCIDREGTNSAKWEFMKKISPYANENTIPLWVADMDFACAPEIIEAIAQRVDEKIFGYSMAEPSYYESVQNWFLKNLTGLFAVKIYFLLVVLFQLWKPLFKFIQSNKRGLLFSPCLSHVC